MIFERYNGLSLKYGYSFRFYAIVCPLKSGRNIKVFLLLAWVGAFLSASPQAYVFHVETHPNVTWYTQCVTFNSFPSPAYETAYTVFGILMMYLVPLVSTVLLSLKSALMTLHCFLLKIFIVVTYTFILMTIYRKSRAANGE